MLFNLYNNMKDRISLSLCDKDNKIFDCIQKYSFNYGDIECLFNQGNTGSNCITKNGCISIIGSCQNDNNNLFAYCGWPELNFTT